MIEATALVVIFFNFEAWEWAQFEGFSKEKKLEWIEYWEEEAAKLADEYGTLIPTPESD